MERADEIPFCSIGLDSALEAENEAARKLLNPNLEHYHTVCPLKPFSHMILSYSTKRRTSKSVETGESSGGFEDGLHKVGLEEIKEGKIEYLSEGLVRKLGHLNQKHRRQGLIGKKVSTFLKFEAAKGTEYYSFGPFRKKNNSSSSHNSGSISENINGISSRTLPNNSRDASSQGRKGDDKNKEPQGLWGAIKRLTSAGKDECGEVEREGGMEVQEGKDEETAGTVELKCIGKEGTGEVYVGQLMDGQGKEMIVVVCGHGFTKETAERWWDWNTKTNKVHGLGEDVPKVRSALCVVYMAEITILHRIACFGLDNILPSPINFNTKPNEAIWSSIYNIHSNNNDNSSLGSEKRWMSLLLSRHGIVEMGYPLTPTAINIGDEHETVMAAERVALSGVLGESLLSLVHPEDYPSSINSLDFYDDPDQSTANKLGGNNDDQAGFVLVAIQPLEDRKKEMKISSAFAAHTLSLVDRNKSVSSYTRLSAQPGERLYPFTSELDLYSLSLADAQPDEADGQTPDGNTDDNTRPGSSLEIVSSSFVEEQYQKNDIQSNSGSETNKNSMVKNASNSPADDYLGPSYDLLVPIDSDYHASISRNYTRRNSLFVGYGDHLNLSNSSGTRIGNLLEFDTSGVPEDPERPLLQNTTANFEPHRKNELDNGLPKQSGECQDKIDINDFTLSENSEPFKNNAKNVLYKNGGAGGKKSLGFLPRQKRLWPIRTTTLVQAQLTAYNKMKIVLTGISEKGGLNADKYERMKPFLKVGNGFGVLGNQMSSLSTNYTLKYREKLMAKARREGYKSIEEMKQAYFLNKRKINLDNEGATESSKSSESAPSVKDSSSVNVGGDSGNTNSQVKGGTGIAPGNGGDKYASRNNLPPTVKSLDKIVKMELLENKTAKEIEEIWKVYHMQSPTTTTLDNKKATIDISAVIPTESYKKLLDNSTKTPFFILPLPREQKEINEDTKTTSTDANNGGIEFYVVQFDHHMIYFTSLLEYQTKTRISRAGGSSPGTAMSGAQPYLILTHYTDFIESKGIVLMRGEITTNSHILDIQSAQLLVMIMQLFYVTPNEQRQNIMNIFKNDPSKFNYNQLINSIDVI
ncbi:ATP synthase mitochondrial F1 complex assembly factor 1 [Zancudomyces culisetae]|uniref:ATP synthase mitochondrial F1 complex assembly factor 1 n=1 Tax=Zancudomyces culisetae TaxID=1213189 RepID=A0A1R1PZG4_ZANCU|nr:ATP synthase mitochondrial F1 complex assembly factor 1 [Zancudomyces culisetae]|eukprot:OMH86341.1 ATP synthase mitochondrial F1 complex assembly factor 1 [Zancudomyces culisetae]